MDLTSTFCPAPFIHQSTKTDGSIKACCRSLPRISSIKDETLLEAWNNTEIKKLRHDLLNGIRNPRCNTCWKLEDSNIESLRHKYNKREIYGEQAAENLKSMNPDFSLNNKPTWIEFKLSNLCNFKCRMCHVMDSTKWFDDHKKIKHLHTDYWQAELSSLNLEEKPLLGTYDENFYRDLPEAMSNITEIWFAGGEPLYDDNHYRILDSVMDRAHEITLSYATNLSMLSNKKYNVIEYWKKFKSIQVSVSLDGPPELNEYIRSGANSSDIEKNIRYLLDHLPNVSVTGKITVQALNVYHVPETMDWFKRLNVHFTGVHFVDWPEHLDARIWIGEPRNLIKAKLADYLKKYSTNDMNIRNSVRNVLKYFDGSTTHTDEQWGKFLEWNAILDESRNESFSKCEFLKTWMK